MNKLTKFYDMTYYAAMLQRFLSTGLVELRDAADPLGAYLAQLFRDPLIRVQALSNTLNARIFEGITMRFVSDMLDKMRFNAQRLQSDVRQLGKAVEWSYRKRQDGWQGLVETIAQKYEAYGFDKQFFLDQFERADGADAALWERMVDAWRVAMERKMREQSEELIRRRQSNMRQHFEHCLDEIPKCLQKHRCSDIEFRQAWNMMDGGWNEVEFKRYLRVVRLQKQYPQIAALANRMGRIADDAGHHWMSFAAGQTMKLDHAAHSDIVGITTGRDLGALLPSEVAVAADDSLQDIFFERFATGRLQMFRHRSEMLKSSRRVSRRPALRRGAMIVCIDHSQSMEGRPEQVAQSALLRVLSIAHEQRRKCYLIGFSVGMHALDVGHNPATAFDFFRAAAGGGTNPEAMIAEMLRVLESDDTYTTADVLWITDFRFLPTNRSQLQSMRRRHEKGTSFFALQVGRSKYVEPWRPLFDEVLQADYILSRRF